MRLRRGGMRALQTGTAEAPARAFAERRPRSARIRKSTTSPTRSCWPAAPASRTSTAPTRLKLVDLMNRFAEIYWATKDIKTVRKPCPYPPNIEVVYPVLWPDRAGGWPSRPEQREQAFANTFSKKSEIPSTNQRRLRRALMARTVFSA